MNIYSNGLELLLNIVIVSLVLARKTKIMYSIFFYLILLLSVITMYINFILDVELS